MCKFSLFLPGFLVVLVFGPAVPTGSLRADSFVYAANCCTGGSSLSIIDNQTASQLPGKPLVGMAVAVILSPDGQTVYTATQDPNLLFAVSAQTATTNKAVDLGMEPVAIALSPDGGTIYAAGCEDGGSCWVDVRNASDLSSIATVNLGQNPIGALALSLDGSHLYATIHPTPPRLHGRASGPSGVVDIVAATNAVSRFLPMLDDFPNAIRISPAGTIAYISDSVFPLIYTLDLNAGLILSSFRLPSNAAAIALSKDGLVLYVSSAMLYALSATSGEILDSWFIDYVTAGITLSPSGSACYVADYYSNTIDTFDIALGRVTARVPAGFHPVDVAVTGDGSTSYAANSGASTVLQLDETTSQPTREIEAGAEPYAVAISSDGSTVYAANFYSSNVSVISTSTLTRTANIPTGQSPREMVLSPDGSRLYVADSDASITVIDTGTNLALSRIPTSPNGQTLAFGLAISPDGSTLYSLTNFLEFQGILVIDAATGRIASKIPLRGDLAEIAVSPDGLNAYVTGNSSQGFIIVVDLVRGIEVRHVNAYKPFNIKISPDGQFIYTGSADIPAILVFDRSSGEQLAATAVAGNLGLALNGDGSRLYATGPALTVYDTASRRVVDVVRTAGPTLGVAAQ